MGIAFDNITFSESIFPAMTSKSDNTKLNLGERPLKHLPPNATPIFELKQKLDNMQEVPTTKVSTYHLYHSYNLETECFIPFSHCRPETHH
jgi:hypothetical protein